MTDVDDRECIWGNTDERTRLRSLRAGRGAEVIAVDGNGNDGARRIESHSLKLGGHCGCQRHVLCTRKQRAAHSRLKAPTRRLPRIESSDDLAANRPENGGTPHEPACGSSDDRVRPHHDLQNSDLATVAK